MSILRICPALWLILTISIDCVISKDCHPTKSTASGRFAPEGKLCSGQLLLDEHFESFRPSLWQNIERFRGPGQEFHWYTAGDNNTFLHEGNLNLMATLTTDIVPDLTHCDISLKNCIAYGGSCNYTCSAKQILPPARSALITSRGGFQFKYGRVEIRAKMPTGDWLWPAMWLMPLKNKYGGWPLSGEIDLCETLGNAVYKVKDEILGLSEFGSTLHFGTKPGKSGWQIGRTNMKTRSNSSVGFNSWHVYGMEWTPEHFIFSIDGKEYGKIPTGDGYFKRGQFIGTNPWIKGNLDAPFDEEFFFFFNNAVGGTSFIPDGKGKPWSKKDNKDEAMLKFWNARVKWLPTWNMNSKAPLNTALQVDYIKVYAL